MPGFVVTGPDGKKYKVNTPEGATQDQAIAYVAQTYYKIGQQPAPAQDDRSLLGDIGRDIVRGTGTMISGLGLPLEELPSLVLTDNGEKWWKDTVRPASQWLQQKGQELSGTVAPRTTGSVFDEYNKNGVGGALRSLVDTVFEGAAPTIGGLVTGLATKNPAAAMAVMGLTGLPQEYTGIRQQQMQTGDNNIGKALLGATVVTAMDTLMGSGGAVAKLGEKAVYNVIESGLKHAAKEVVKTGAEEGGTEAIQNIIEQIAGGADPTTKDSLKQTLEAGLAGMVGGGVFGSVAEGANNVMRSRLREAAKNAPPLHSMEITPPNGQAQQVDILSAPTREGEVIVRNPNGDIYTSNIKSLEQMRTAVEGEEQAPLHDVLKEAVEKRTAAENLNAAVAKAISKPDDDAAFDEVVDRYSKYYGVPRAYAEEYASAYLGRMRGEIEDTANEAKGAQPEAAPAAAAPAPVEAEQAPPTVTPQAAPVTPQAAPAQVAPVAPQATPVQAAPTPPIAVTQPEVQDATKPAPVAEQQAAPIDEAAMRKAAFAEANRFAPDNDILATAFYIGAINQEPDEFFKMHATEGEWAAYEAGKKFAAEKLGVAPPVETQQEQQAPELPPELASPQEEQLAAESPVEEAQQPVLEQPAPQEEAPVAAPEETPVAEQAAPEAAPEAAPQQEPETYQGVPIKKVAPGDARGARETRRGVQGTQMGRPVEGAAALTEGMRAQQDLTSQVEAAQNNREINAKEAGEVLDFLRPPANQMELRSLPVEQRNRWVDAISAQKDVDAYRERMKEIPKQVLGKENPEYLDAQKVLSNLQKRLDQSQRELVAAAKDALDKKIAARKAETEDLKRKIKDPNTPAKDRREAMIALRERRVNPMLEGMRAGNPAEHARVEQAIRGMNREALLHWLSKTAKDPFHRLLAKRINDVLGKLESETGAKVQVHIIEKLDDVPPYMHEVMAKSRAMCVTNPDGGSDIFVWGKDSKLVGTAYMPLLHEFVHAAVENGLYLGRNAEFFDVPHLEKAVRDLDNVFNHLKEVMADLRSGAMPIPAGLEDLTHSILGDEHRVLENTDELLAWAMTDPTFQEFLDKVPYPNSQRSFFSKLVESIRKLLGFGNKYESALTEVIHIADELMGAPTSEILKSLVDPHESEVYTMKAKETEQKINKGVHKAQMASSAAGFLSGLDEASKLTIKEKGSVMLSSGDSWLDPKLLYITPTDMIKDKVAEMRPELGKVLGEMEEVDQRARGMRTSMLEAMARRVKEFRRFVNKNGQKELSDMMTIARVNRVDVTEARSLAELMQKDKVLSYYQNREADQNLTDRQRALAKGGVTKRTADLKAAWDAWEKLGTQKGGQELYKRTRQFYKDMYVALRAAQDAEIRSLNIDEESKNRLIEAAHGLEDENAVTEEDDAHPGIPQSLFPKEYFPFRRFGEHVLLVKGHKRGDRERYHFETAKERDAFLIKRAKQLGISKDDERFTKLDGLQNLKNNMSEDSFMLKKMFDVIDKANLKLNANDNTTSAHAEKEKLKDKLYQTYLMTLPERSLRKQFLHAELVTGHSADVQRIFTVAASQYAAQLPRITFGRKLQRLIETAYESIEGGSADERLKLQRAVDAYVGRFRQSMEPQTQGKWEQRINTFTFFSFMTSLASAAVQPLVLPFQVMPRMVFRYGPIETFKMLDSYMPVWKIAQAAFDEDPATGERWFVAPSIGNMDFIKNNKLRAELWNKLNNERDLFSQKHSNMLLRNRPTRFHSTETIGQRGAAMYESIVNASGALFSTADQIAREVAGMSLAELHYRQQRAKGLSHADAMNAAVDASIRNTNETVGNYTELNKPDLFRGNAFKRMLGFLRTYSINRTAYYFKMMNAILKGSPFQTRWQAFGELSSQLALTALAGGVATSFGYSFICGLINKLLPTLFSDDENEKRRRLDPLGADDADYRFRYEWIPYNFGSDSMATKVLQHGALSIFTGGDLSSRISQNDLWIREARQGKDWKGTLGNYLLQNVSPQLSEAGNLVDGMEAFSEGDWSKGFQKLLPAAVRGFVSAERLQREGAKTSSGKSIMKPSDFTENQLMLQRAGLTPLPLAVQREQNARNQGWQYAMMGKRNDLLNRFRKVMDDPNRTAADVNEVIDAMEAYNRSVPIDRHTGLPLSKYLIEAQDVMKSSLTSDKKEAQSIRGVEVSPGEAPYLYQQR